MIIPWVYFVKDNEQLLVDSFTGCKVINGPQSIISRPFDTITKRSGIQLKATEYVHVTDQLSGDMKLIKGPQLYFLGAYEEIIEKAESLSLLENQYAIINDKLTGEQRFIQGSGKRLTDTS